ncbi:hypothetical protein PINS_up015028 [Pythium insidiosum]|nr:hypothetical protein PINS_up015028 [Pythium insidiosum]
MLWAQAERLNLAAYVAWNAEQDAPAVATGPPILEAACREWSRQPEMLFALLRALPYPEVAVSILPPDVVVRLGNELLRLLPDRTLPVFVRADDPADAFNLWLQLIVLVVIASDRDVDIAACVLWLRNNPDDASNALHALRLHDWTVIEALARAYACASLSHPNRPAASALGADRL